MRWAPGGQPRSVLALLDRTVQPIGWLRTQTSVMYIPEGDTYSSISEVDTHSAIPADNAR